MKGIGSIVTPDWGTQVCLFVIMTCVVYIAVTLTFISAYLSSIAKTTQGLLHAWLARGGGRG